MKEKQSATDQKGQGGTPGGNATPPPGALSLWSVTLKCPTPLAEPQMVIEAKDEAEAREFFMKANGISGSAHDWVIEKA